jgi:hypothetical protein
MSTTTRRDESQILADKSRTPGMFDRLRTATIFSITR